MADKLKEEISVIAEQLTDKKALSNVANSLEGKYLFIVDKLKNNKLTESIANECREAAREFCSGITDYSCRSVWKAGRQKGLDSIDEICPSCKLWNYCTQNTKNHGENRFYYHMTTLAVLLNDPDKNKDEIIERLNKMIELEQEMYEFIQYVEDWNK